MCVFNAMFEDLLFLFLSEALTARQILATSETLDSLLDSIGDSDLAVQIGHALPEHIVYMLEKDSVGAAATVFEKSTCEF